jgi:hypothetical protein
MKTFVAMHFGNGNLCRLSAIAANAVFTLHRSMSSASSKNEKWEQCPSRAFSLSVMADILPLKCFIFYR